MLERARDGLRDLERDGRRVHAEDDVRPRHGCRSVGRELDPGWARDGVPAADAAARCDEVAGEPAAGLPETEHGNLHPHSSTSARRPCRS